MTACAIVAVLSYGGCSATQELNGGTATTTGAGGTAGAPANGEDGATASLPVCNYAAGLIKLDGSASSAACVAARAALSCPGSGTSCLSDDLDKCPDPYDVVGVKCTDVCAADEYGVACDDNPNFADLDAATPSPPSNCHGGISTPGGGIVCCPCN